MQVRAGTAARVSARLGRLAARVRRTSSPDLLLATVPTAELASLAADRDVADVSSNAPVRSLGDDLSKDLLLDTEGLLATRQNGQTIRTVPYTGRGVGVALVDSGIASSGDLNNILFFDFTNGGRPALPPTTTDTAPTSPASSAATAAGRGARTRGSRPTSTSSP